MSKPKDDCEFDLDYLEELLEEANMHELDPDTDLTWASVRDEDEDEMSDDGGISDYE